MATFFRQFPEEENKKSKEIGQEKVALKQSQLAVGRRPASAAMAFPLHHCHRPRWLVAYSDREKIAQLRVTQSNKVKGA